MNTVRPGRGRRMACIPHRVFDCWRVSSAIISAPACSVLDFRLLFTRQLKPCLRRAMIPFRKRDRRRKRQNNMRCRRTARCFASCERSERRHTASPMEGKDQWNALLACGCDTDIHIPAIDLQSVSVIADLTAPTPSNRSNASARISWSLRLASSTPRNVHICNVVRLC